ncbi:MAG: macrolide transporter ATP-binding protein [Bacillales bacterium]|jgi:putative ABC transport system ATP-binding protein|nr:macrolide transporter ATP-binding protein [Bacillales bacterium]
MISIKNMSQTYTLGDETIHALDQISLDIKRGDFISIIGPSGSGKSTLMNMIGCLDTPDTGWYELDGRSINETPDSELATIRNEKIGFIFQNFNLISKLTAFENVELPLIYRGLKAKERKIAVMEALEKVGILSRAGHLPTQLSGGQQQRVAIARALAGKPQILLADEPTGALDSKTGQEIIQIMKSLNELGHTIIIITHDLNIAKQTKRIVHIHDGKLSEEGVL